MSNTQNINDLIAQASQNIVCGPNTQCGIDKVTTDLEKKYEASKVNLRTAPIQLDESEKNYYLHTRGQSGYDKILTDKYTRLANSDIEQKRSEFDQNIKKTSQLNDTLNSLTINYINESELYENYLKKNGLVKQKIEETGSELVTNDRKTYYENENYDLLTAWYKVWRYIYIFLLLAFVLGMFLVPSDYSFKQKAAILLVFMAYPFIIDRIVLFIIGVFFKIGSFIPRNVYYNF